MLGVNIPDLDPDHYLTWLTIKKSHQARRCDLLVPGSRGLILHTTQGPESDPVPYLRTVRPASGAIAAQIVYSGHRGSRQIEHIGSAL
jgi:hypothetical protein